MKEGYIYFLANKTNTVLYIGVTSDLVKRVYEHKEKKIKGFSEKYNCTRLVYYEKFDEISNAIEREKQLKNWHREWKNNLVNEFNPEWNDLYEEMLK